MSGMLYIMTFVTSADGGLPYAWSGVMFFVRRDGHDISAILFVGGPAAGKFDFQIDDVKLE